MVASGVALLHGARVVRGGRLGGDALAVTGGPVVAHAASLGCGSHRRVHRQPANATTGSHEPSSEVVDRGVTSWLGARRPRSPARTGRSRARRANGPTAGCAPTTTRGS